MKKIDIGQSMNTVVNVGMISGIVFLAPQLQQNNLFAAESARSARYEAALSAYELVLNNPDLLCTTRKARSEELADEEKFTLSVHFTRIWLGLQHTIDNTTESDRATFVRAHRRTFEEIPV